MNRRPIKRRSKKVGLPPGTLLHIGEKRAEPTQISVIEYDEAGVRERKDVKIEECLTAGEGRGVTWINLDGLHEVDNLEKLGSAYGLHPLLLEDVLNTDQRPKMEDFGDHIYIVLKMLSYDQEKHVVISEQVSLVLRQGLVLALQEWRGDVFDPVRERIRNGKGRIRSQGAGYLTYSLLDAVIDNYFVVLEKLGEQIESIEEELLARPSDSTLRKIHILKREMIDLRRAVWPLREVVNSLERGESPLIGETNRIYLRDVYDHTIHVIDTLEAFRDVLSGMLEIYLSSVSNRVNVVVKVLTVITTIFMPLTFLAGIYGMNFEFMPELKWRWGYPTVLVVMLALGVTMLIFFKRKKWL